MALPTSDQVTKALEAAVKETLAAKEEADATVIPSGYGLLPYYSNRFHLWANDHIMRFIIGDSIAGQDVDFKLSFVMTRQDAAAMLEAAQQLLKDTEPKNTTVQK